MRIAADFGQVLGESDQKPSEIRDRIVSWRAAPTGCLLYEMWEDGYSVFCRLTGETHQLNELPAEIVRRLEKSPRTISCLAAELSAECEIEDSSDWRRKIAAIVRELHQLELLDKVG